jgi:predicted DNA-binding antitoxin AbrB/MazE fold protein
LLLKPITFQNGFKMKVNVKEHLSEKLLNITVKVPSSNYLSEYECGTQGHVGNKN